MTSAPLFEGTVTHDVRDDRTGRFASRRKAADDLPLFAEPSAVRREASPGKIAPRKSTNGESFTLQGSPFTSGKVRGGGQSAKVEYVSGRKLDRRAEAAAREAMSRQPDLFGGHTLA